VNNKGFTLIELLATIAILALISVISVVSINEFISKSKDNDYENIKNAYITAAKEYVSDNRYGSIESSISASELYTNHYLTNKSDDPKTGKEFDLDKIYIKISSDNSVYTYEIVCSVSNDNDISNCVKE